VAAKTNVEIRQSKGGGLYRSEVRPIKGPVLRAKQNTKEGIFLQDGFANKNRAGKELGKFETIDGKSMSMGGIKRPPLAGFRKEEWGETPPKSILVQGVNFGIGAGDHTGKIVGREENHREESPGEKNLATKGPRKTSRKKKEKWSPVHFNAV